MKSLGFRAHQKGLELIYDVQPDVPDALVGDPGRLRQVLVNLVGNAIKFTERGEILVAVGREASVDERVRLRFSVSDTGVGIPHDKQEKVFEAFSQADGSTTRKYGGTGLGLTICSKLTELMGGTIWVESQPGQGSTFHFTACLEVNGQPIQSAPPLEIEELHNLPVLIVDDNLTNRRVLHGMVSRWGCRRSRSTEDAPPYWNSKAPSWLAGHFLLSCSTVKCPAWTASRLPSGSKGIPVWPGHNYYVDVGRSAKRCYAVQETWHSGIPCQAYPPG